MVSIGIILTKRERKLICKVLDLLLKIKVKSHYVSFYDGDTFGKEEIYKVIDKLGEKDE